MPQTHILVVDDEPDIRQLMREILEDEGYSVNTASDGESARQAVASQVPDLVLLDIWMPDVDGITLLKEWKESGRVQCPVVMVSGHGTLETAVEATRLGAHDFIQKPLSLAKLLATVKQALASRDSGPKELQGEAGADDGLPPGSSAQAQLLRQKIEQVARHRSPVLITGPSGTNKEGLAAYLHRASGVTGAFVVLDSGRLDGGEQARHYIFGNENLGEAGLLRAAAGGTLFLPEIQALEPETQGWLAALLAKREPSGAAGGAQFQPCRLVASGTGNLEQKVRDGDLLDQLYLQLNVLSLHLPALAERAQDVPELVRHCVDLLANQQGLGYRHFPIPALNRLRNHDWPGNERELRNLVQRLLVTGNSGDVSVAEIEAALHQPPAAPGDEALFNPAIFELPLREARERFEREYLLYQLRKAGGSVGRLSEAVGMERTHLYRKLRSLGIDPRSVTSSG